MQHYLLYFACLIMYYPKKNRHMKVQLRTLNYVSLNLDKGNICPACPKVSNCIFFAS